MKMQFVSYKACFLHKQIPILKEVGLAKVQNTTWVKNSPKWQDAIHSTLWVLELQGVEDAVRAYGSLTDLVKPAPLKHLDQGVARGARQGESGGTTA